MGDLHSRLLRNEQRPLYRLLFSFLIVTGAGVSLFTIMFLAGRFIFYGSQGFLTNLSSGSEITDASFMKYILVSEQISFFIIPALIIMNIFSPQGKPRFSELGRPSTNDIVLVIVLAICIFPVTSFTGELNSQMHFPQWLSGVEKWMTDKEESADKIIDVFTSSGKLTSLFTNILIIAVLPAFGEELIFRGVLQKVLSGFFKSGHPAVWITSFFFSAMHMQFFGFLPRFILGLIFGYLFLWSGTLWLPMLAHFINNAVSIGWDYFHNGDNTVDSADPALLKQIPGMIIPVLIMSLILCYFYMKNRRELQVEKDRGEVNESERPGS